MEFSDPTVAYLARKIHPNQLGNFSNLSELVEYEKYVQDKISDLAGESDNFNEFVELFQANFEHDQEDSNERLKRSSIADPGLLYIPLGSSSSSPSSASTSCPTREDASLVSLMQMAFLSMTVSVFTLVASISNNLNNNNNNDNNNNVNFVNQKNNNLNMNQNIVNQINIDLPPPVPGRRKRSAEELQLMEKLRMQFRQREHELMTVQSSSSCLANELMAQETIDVISEIVKDYVLDENQMPSKPNRQCLGREVCLWLNIQSKGDTSKVSFVKRFFRELQISYLLYLELEDRSSGFAHYLEQVSHNSDKNLDCFELFPKCGMSNEYDYISTKAM